MQIQKRRPKISNRSRNCLSNDQINKPKQSFQAYNVELDLEVKQCIQRIVSKMENGKMATLQPPFFQKTLTKFRQQSYAHRLKKITDQKLSSQNQSELKAGLKLLDSFIYNFDEQLIDSYIQQIRQPYIRKIFNEGYQIDKLDFKRLNSEYELRKQIQEVLNQTSEWLIQLELLEDVLSRVELYFGIKVGSIMGKLKAEGAEDIKGSWIDSFRSLIRKTTSYALRKGSKVVQNSGYAAVLSPGFAMLTWAIIGGNSASPWKGGIDIKTILIPILAFTVPYMLDSMAQGIERCNFKNMLQNWAQQFDKINDSLRHFNQLILKQINLCTQASSREQYLLHHTNLHKYVDNLQKKLEKVSNYDEKVFDQMRQRTKAYFMKYIQVQDGEWIAVMTPQQYQRHKKSNNQEEK